MNNEKEWKIMDLSMEATEKAIGCSREFFQKVMQSAQPADGPQGIRIYVTPLLPAALSDGSEVHAIIVAESPASSNYPIWTEGSLVHDGIFFDWVKRINQYR